MLDKIIDFLMMLIIVANIVSGVVGILIAIGRGDVSLLGTAAMNFGVAAMLFSIR